MCHELLTEKVCHILPGRYTSSRAPSLTRHGGRRIHNLCRNHCDKKRRAEWRWVEWVAAKVLQLLYKMKSAEIARMSLHYRQNEAGAQKFSEN